MPRTYDVVLQEELKSDGVQGAIKRARKQLMMQLSWPQCGTCWSPFGLNGIVLGPSQVQVYLLCERCLNNGSLNYNSHSELEKVKQLMNKLSEPYLLVPKSSHDWEQTEDLLG